LKPLLCRITDSISTKKGMWLSLAVWLIAAMLLGAMAPGSRDYESTVTGQGLPETAKSVVAERLLETYFSNDEGITALVVVAEDSGELDVQKVADAAAAVEASNLEHVKSIVPIHKLPPAARGGFISEDGSTAVLPVLLHAGLEVEKVEETLGELEEIMREHTGAPFVRTTGPAGISVDTVNLFKRADVTLLLATIGLIFILLIVIYRSPLLVFIPLLACAFVYEVADKTLGLLGGAGLPLDSQSLSIMTILLFAAVTDYSLLIFARFREELKVHDNKYDAMKAAMRGAGEPVTFSSGTVLVAMLVLFVAELKDYRVFAPVFATVMAIIMIASLTLLPSLFLLFGRKSFWPKIPKIGDAAVKDTSFWSRTGRLVTAKPRAVAITMLLVLAILGLNFFNIQYQFDPIQSFPEDMPSREGYEKLRQHFAKGELAQTTVIVKTDSAIPGEKIAEFAELLAAKEGVARVTPGGTAGDGTIAKFSLVFAGSPYAPETLDALDAIRAEERSLLDAAGIGGELHFAGETAKQLDIRSVNARDTRVIVLFETLFILLLLWVMTRSLRTSAYMMGTILISYAAAIGLGLFLVDALFGYEAINTRIPIYAFVFLAALGVDYNIMLMSRLLEERKTRELKDAVMIAVSRTGGVISSAGVILAATFSVLMTQPIAELFVFGFITALGILMDVFLVRGLLLPALAMLLERKGGASALK